MSDEPIILIIDDDNQFRELLRKILVSNNHTVVEASCADGATKYLKSAGPCDLVLLDLMLPGINGMELCAELRKKYSKFELPVVMISSETDSKIRKDCLDSGANNYITKPVSLEKLLELVAVHIENTQKYKRFLNKEISPNNDTISSRMI